MALINPIDPIEIKSSWSIFVVEYFLLIWATNLKFLSINIFLASSSPDYIFSIHSFSSSGDNGSGNKLFPWIYPNTITADFKKVKKPVRNVNNKTDLQILYILNICWRKIKVPDPVKIFNEYLYITNE